MFLDKVKFFFSIYKKHDKIFNISLLAKEWKYIKVPLFIRIQDLDL